MRSRVQLRYAAFAASFIAAAERFMGPDGFFPELEPIFGMHAFNVGGHRFARFCTVANGVRVGGAVADALIDAWDTMRLELGDAPTDGPLALGVADAGRGVASHLQRAITAQRETVAAARLREALTELPMRDERRVAYLQGDRFSTQFLATWTRADWALLGGDFEDHLAVVMGWPSPLTLPHAGRQLRDGRGGTVTLGAHGWELGTVVTTGRLWDAQHDAIERTIFVDTTQAGIEGERQPRAIFNAVIPPAALAAEALGEVDEGDEAHPRHSTRQSIVPDARFKRRRQGGLGAEANVLVDAKTLHYSATTYPDASLRPPGVWRRRRVQSAVDRRAARVVTDYNRHARVLDRRIHGVTAEQQEAGLMGPIQTELQRYEVEGHAFGTFGEASASVHVHLCTVARAAAQRWRGLGARSFSEAYGRLKSAYYRKWGATIARANAGLRRARLEFVGARGSRVREYAADDGQGVVAPGALDELVVDVGGGFGGGLGAVAA